MIDVKELEDYKVYQTSNYDLFKKLNGNRDVKNEKVIIKSIQKIGLIDNPIIVNEKYEVIDGQNRLKALQTLNMPVLFHVIPGLNIDDAIAAEEEAKEIKEAAVDIAEKQLADTLKQIYLAKR